jgi:hypothetical protein
LAVVLRRQRALRLRLRIYWLRQREILMRFDFAAAATLALCTIFGAGYVFRAIDRRDGDKDQ